MVGKFLLRRMAAISALLLLIADSHTAIQGARDGLSLCMEVLIPSLFPFFVISRLMGRFSAKNTSLTGKILRRAGVPDGCEDLVTLGFLCGYPAGAANVAQAWRDGFFSRREAENLLPLCSNAGPAFLFGVMGRILEGPRDCWLLWAVLILSTLLTWLLGSHSPVASGEKPDTSACDLPHALAGGVKSMALVCGWVILFRVLLAFLDRYVFSRLPVYAGLLLTGFLEISNGCTGLHIIASSDYRLILAAGILSWGGICILLQTQSVAAGLSIGHYIRFKLFQTFLSIVIAFLCVTVSRMLIWGFALLVLFLAGLPREKRGSNSRLFRV